MMHLRPSALDEALRRIKEIAKKHADETIIRESLWLADRAQAGELTVLVAGQFKRGKSTFINALLGEDALPTGVLPLTSVVTMIHFGQSRRAIVSFRHGDSVQIDVSQLAQYVTEAANPENRLRVLRVDVELPIPILDGIRVVDTPGIASTFLHNTEAARESLREADLAILVVGPEPPIGEAEIGFIKEVRDAAERLFVVFNKADVLADQERELVGFTKSQLHEALGFVPHLFVLSSRDALQAAGAGGSDRRFQEFLDEFGAFLRKHRDSIRERSFARKIAGLARRLQLLISLKRHAFLLPLEQRKTARARFEELVRESRVRSEELKAATIAAMRDGARQVDGELEQLLSRSCKDLAAELSQHARGGDPNAFERALESGASRQTSGWISAVHVRIEELTREQTHRVMLRVTELEEEILTLGLRVVNVTATIPHAAMEAFDVPGISLPKERIADTGLELLIKGGITLLPAPLRARLLMRNLEQSVRERLDARRGRLRYAAHQEIDRIAGELTMAAQRRLVAAEASVRAALNAATSIDDSLARACSEELAVEEQMLEALAVDLEASLEVPATASL